MTRRHSLYVVVGVLLTALLVWGAGAPGIQAADVKTPPPAPAAGPGTPDAKVKPVPAAAKATSEQAPAAVKLGAPAAPAQTPTSPAVVKPGAPAVPVPIPTQGYHITGKTDPFKPFMETDLALKLKQEEDLKKKAVLKTGRPISPLQQADIAQFRLVGIAGDQNKRTAVVEDGIAKKYYPLSVGTYIGQNGGRVAAILDDRVIIEERIENQDEKPAKKVKLRRVTVMLHKEKEEGKQ